MCGKNTRAEAKETIRETTQRTLEAFKFLDNSVKQASENVKSGSKNFKEASHTLIQGIVEGKCGLTKLNQQMLDKLKKLEDHRDMLQSRRDFLAKEVAAVKLDEQAHKLRERALKEEIAKLKALIKEARSFDSNNKGVKNLKRKIQAYKILTGISFAYNVKDTVCGYAFNPVTKKTKPFQIGSQEDADKIAKELWKAVDDVAEGDWCDEVLL